MKEIDDPYTIFEFFFDAKTNRIGYKVLQVQPSEGILTEEYIATIASLS